MNTGHAGVSREVRGVEIAGKERNFLRGTGKHELAEFLFPSFIDSHSDNIFYRENIVPRVKYVYSLLIHCEITPSLRILPLPSFLLINVFSFLNVTQFQYAISVYSGQHDVISIMSRASFPVFNVILIF